MLNIFIEWTIKIEWTLVQHLGELEDTVLPLQPAGCVTGDKSFHYLSFCFFIFKVRTMS